MPNYEALVTFERRNAIPEDAVVNTFWFDAPSDAAAATLSDRLYDFYNDVQASGFAIRSYLSEALSGNLNIRVYNHADAPPRVPVHNEDYTLTGLSGSDELPAELAICLSFKAAALSGTIPARRRGRVYIGPLATNAMASVANEAFVPLVVRNTILQAADSWHADCVTEGGAWRVFSRVNNNFVAVAEGWVDNAFDVQRRRGVRATARTTLAF